MRLSQFGIVLVKILTIFFLLKVRKRDEQVIDAGREFQILR